MSTKECFKCHQNLPLSEFYRHPRMADGHIGKCRECAQADVRTNYQKHIDRCHEYDKGRSRLEKRVAMQQAYGRRWNEEDPRKRRAQGKAYRALKRGQLHKESCYFCDSNKDIEMHHPDYDRPLRVYWLCRRCHRRLDNMTKLGLNNEIGTGTTEGSTTLIIDGRE
jgi:hypothetical protein